MFENSSNKMLGEESLWNCFLGGLVSLRFCYFSWMQFCCFSNNIIYISNTIGGPKSRLEFCVLFKMVAMLLN